MRTAGLRLVVTPEAKEYPILNDWINEVEENRVTYIPNKEKQEKEQDGFYSLFGITKDREQGEEVSSIYIAKQINGDIHIIFSLSDATDLESCPIGVEVVDPITGKSKDYVEIPSMTSDELMNTSNLAENYPLTTQMLSNVESPLVAAWIEDGLGIDAIELEGNSPRFSFVLRDFVKENWDRSEKFLDDYNKMETWQKVMFGISEPIFAIQKKHEQGLWISQSKLKPVVNVIFDKLNEMGPDHIPAA